ncbi:excisionase family DNA-binding protein [Clavibacter tessellarius]|uniref:excisionase family DNA-binding protein n=1 Tax=Clavibacter tessellarius TaxID=31965 RepID=UPI003248C607
MTQNRDRTPRRAADADEAADRGRATAAPTRYRVSEAAALIGVSDDTLRRWADAGRLDLVRGEGRLILVDGVQLAHLATEPRGGRGARRIRLPSAARVGAQPDARHRHARRARRGDGAGRDPGGAVPGGVAHQPRGRRRDSASRSARPRSRP